MLAEPARDWTLDELSNRACTSRATLLRSSRPQLTADCHAGGRHRVIPRYAGTAYTHQRAAMATAAATSPSPALNCVPMR